MPIETIIAPVGKSDPSFDLQTDIIFGGNGGAKMNKFLDCVKNIVIGRNPRINMRQNKKKNFIILELFKLFLFDKNCFFFFTLRTNFWNTETYLTRFPKFKSCWKGERRTFEITVNCI